MKLLLIEDDKDLRLSIAAYLAEAGHTCEIARDKSSAAGRLGSHEYDVVLLDITLPDGSGLELLRDLRSSKNSTGVLIISARDALDDRLGGLDLGADDYLAKPFHLAELHARINAIFRRRQANGHTHLPFEDLDIDLQARTAKAGGKELSLTAKEYNLLLYLITNKGRVLTREAIAEHLWGDHIDLADNFDFLYSHIKNLRRKIAAAGSADHLRTVYGIGYRFGTK